MPSGKGEVTGGVPSSYRELDEELKRLWGRCCRGDRKKKHLECVRADLDRLARVVIAILKGHAGRFYSFYASLKKAQMGDDDCINSYFAYKLLPNCDKPGGTETLHATALAGFYRNYLIDHIRAGRDEMLTGSLEDYPDWDSGFITEPEYDTTDPALVLLAREFLISQEDWAIQFLAYRSTEGGEIALDSIRKRFGIPNYDEKARKLGINLTGKYEGNPGAYRDTFIGQWLVGLNLDPAEPGILAQTLKILGREALILLEERGTLVPPENWA